MTFNDLTLHAMLHLNDAKNQEMSLFSLHQTMKGITAEKLQPAIVRGWITTRVGTKKKAADSGGTIVGLTDAGAAQLRRLCSLADAISPIQ